MKTTLQIVVILMVALLPMGVMGQSQKTIIVDGDLSDWSYSTDGDFARGSGQNANWYFAWDNDFFYFAIERVIGSTFGDGDAATIYLDIDGGLNSAIGSGTTTGNLYQGVTATLPFNSDFVIRLERFYKQINRFTGGTWSANLPYTNYSDANNGDTRTVREGKVAWSEITNGSGKPASMAIVAYLSYSTGVFGSMPEGNESQNGNGASKSFSAFVGYTPLNSTVNSNSNRNNFVQYQNITNATGWRLLSSPVSTTYADIVLEGWTQGSTGADVTNGSANVRTYSTAGGFANVADLGATAPAGQGFLYYHYNDDDFNGVVNDGPTTFSVTGAENASGTSFTPAWDSGTEYAIAGNPFTSTIDWDNVTKGDNVHNAVWVWNPATSTYDDYNGANGNLTGGLIAPFQGFWFQYNGTDRGITFPSAAKSTGGSFRGKEETPRRMVVRASDSAGSNLAWVAFRDGATLGEDRYDAVKFTPLSTDYLQAFTIAADKAHGINVLPSDLTDALEIPLGVTSTRGGSITLDLQELNLPEGWVASIRDNVTGVTRAMDAEFSYSYESSRAKAAPVGEAPHVLAATAPRFTLIIDPLNSTSTENGKQTTENFSLEQNYPNPFNPSTVIGFQLSVVGQTKLSVYDVLGREVAVLVNETLPAGSHSVNFDASNLTSGVYMYKLEAGGMSQVRRMTLVK